MCFIYFSQNMPVIFVKRKKKLNSREKYDHVPIIGEYQRFLLLLLFFLRIIIGNQ